MMMRAKNRLSFFAYLTLVFLLVSGVVHAQDSASMSLSYSVVASGEITNSAFSQVWELQTASADRIDVKVERTSGDLIPDVSILNASDEQISQSYGPDQTSAAADIENFTLPGGGTYKVLVQRLEGGTGVTTGEYSILVTPRATAEDNPNNTISLGDVVAGTPVNGELTAVQWYQRYTLAAQAGDVINVSARRTSGTLFPQVEVLDANNATLNTGYTDYYLGDESNIDRLELPGAGNYTVVVTRASGFNGETAGGYELNVTLLGAGEDSPLLATPAGDIVYDTDLSGTINAVWYQDWKLTATAGDTITIIASRAGGTLQPEVALLGGSGQELSHGYVDSSGALADITRYKLANAGTYTVRVTRASGKTGGSSGTYNLKVELVGSGEGSPALAQSTGAIENGQEQTEVITGERWADTWDYKGTKDQKIDIVVNRTDGTLVPRVDIRDRNGQVLTSSYPDASRATVSITNYTLPGTADYKIVVYRDGGQDGYTTGNYSLTVSESAQ
ncbi:MAG: hypothetical protein R3E39_18400 [Anaerolineae bacterium]